jgi:hypothetical protein
MSNVQVPKVGVMAMVRTSRSMKDETLIEMGMELARQYGPIFQLPGSGPRNIVVHTHALPAARGHDEAHHHDRARHRCATLTALYQERARVSTQEAEAWQADLRDKQRYLADVWAKG